MEGSERDERDGVERGEHPSTESEGACRAVGQRAGPVGAEGSLMSKPNPEAVLGSSFWLPSSLRQAMEGPLGHRVLLPLHPPATPCTGTVARERRRDPRVSSPISPPGLQKLGALPLPPQRSGAWRLKCSLMKALVQIDSTELVCLMWGGIVARRRG